MSYTPAEFARQLKQNPALHIVGEPLHACTTACALILPWPPTLNTYRAVANNRLVTSQAGKDYRKAVVSAVLLQRRGRPPFRDRLHVEWNLHAPYNRYDIANFIKAVEDALTHAGVYEDDGLIDHHDIRRKPMSNPGYVAVLIDLCAHKECCHAPSP